MRIVVADVEASPVLAGQRWPIYHRLRELGVPCHCQPHQPLEIQVECPLHALLVWSVVTRMTATRVQQVAWLERCWKMNAGGSCNT